MGGGLMQLVAYGAQDIYLTGNPQITFFKVVYRRHTNFSMEAIEQTWNGTQPGPGRCTATISRNGDLVYRMYIQIKLPGSGTIAHHNPSSSGITDVTLEIGGQQIDKHSGQWMETWAELTEKNPSGTVAATALTDAATSTLFQRMSGMGGVKSSGSADESLKYIPLYFWFCRNPGLALPLIALQYHEVKVILNHSFTTSYAVELQELKLYADYIYLDTDERRRFAQVSHEYLIEQVQEQVSSANTTLELNFNHPVKELIWSAARSSGELVGPGVGDYRLTLNGHDRFATRDLTYFTRTQVKEYHTGVGGLDASTSGAGVFIDAIAVYSFALKPEEHQPSGTCNFSRIDNATLVNPGSAGLTVYAVNYNVLRIMSGMGGLAYSN
jgi:hypothetical protein